MTKQTSLNGHLRIMRFLMVIYHLVPNFYKGLHMGALLIQNIYFTNINQHLHCKLIGTNE